MASKEMTIGITIEKEKDMAEWYGQVVIKSELADYSAVKGCMVIRPRGFSVWQGIVDQFNRQIAMLGVENAYFPMFIPESFFKKEAEHAEGFSPEVAWVTRKDEESSERLALRPTSETIMYDSYSRWIRSWRDLPLRINQWCNIIRWEVSDVKLFMRSREFLWQEGHCAYASEEECEKETLIILEEYRKIAEDLLAIPVVKGKKTMKEKFAGSVYTTTIESFMPDGKALQLGTSHHLGQGFAKAFDINYVGKDEKNHLPWQNSWGFSTRLIGAVVMLHSDNNGLILPPRVAKIKGVIVPIFKEKNKKEVFGAASALKKSFDDAGLLVHMDSREDYSPGWKYNEWELKGIPIRIEIGPKDIEKGECVFVRRDTREKSFVKLEEATEQFSLLLEEIQKSLFDKAKAFFDRSIVRLETWEELVQATTKDKTMALSPFCGEVECEELVKSATGGVTTRCIPFDQPSIEGKKCVKCGKDAKHWVYFARNY